MTNVLHNVMSFPTVVFSVLLLVVLLYWIVACFGFFDAGAPDGGDPGEVGDAGDLDGGDAEAGTGPDDGGGAFSLTGLLLKLGLNGVPLTLVLSLLVLTGWFICYFGVYFGLGRLEPGLVRHALGVGLLAVSLAGGVKFTALVIRPVRRLLRSSSDERSVRSLLGRTVTIRSATVTPERGEAVLDDGGAGLLLQVRAAGRDKSFAKGDTAVILQYDAASHVYSVISEDEFQGR